MTIKIGIIMDPIESIKTYKDSTFAMLLEAQKRGWEIHYMQLNDLSLHKDQLLLNTTKLRVKDDTTQWYTFGCQQQINVKHLDVLLMRKDPPFNIAYLNATYLLDHAKAQGVLVANDPQALRNANEKIYTTWFPQCCVPSVISSDANELKKFFEEEGNVIFKPLDSMGGDSVFHVTQQDPNLNVILEVLTQKGKRAIMAQRYIPEIKEGDKRILLIDGEPIPYALARIAPPGETRANLATGGQGKGQLLSEADIWICKEIGPTLKENGLIFVGIDVIGDFLSEINVTSPTGIREIESQFEVDITGTLFDVIEKKVAAMKGATS